MAIGIPATFAATANFKQVSFGNFRHAFAEKGSTMSGVTLPSAEEMKAHREQMQKVKDAMDNLSDADKATLKQMHEAAAKAERDFLRSKGVPLPTEDEIAKWESQMPKMGKMMNEGFGKMRKGMRDGKRGMHNWQ